MIYFYFYDCPRTGGTSIKHWCKRNNDLKRLYYGQDGGWHHVPFKPLKEIEGLRPQGMVDRIWTLTFLRNPIDHTVSLYAKIRNHKHSYKDKLKNLSFSDWIHGDFIKDVDTAPSSWSFSMVNFYSSDNNLRSAINNIESVDYVGFTDRLTYDMNQFLIKVGTNAKFDGRKLNTSSKNFKITSDEKKIIREVRSRDFELVNHFRKKRGLSLF